MKDETCGEDKLTKMLYIGFFILLIFSLAIYYNRNQTYIRPDVYFLVLSLATGSVFVQIVLLKEKNLFHLLLVSIESIILLISLILTQQAMFKTLLGRDSWFHWILVEEIVKTGKIPSFKNIPIPYVKMPNFHLIIATGIIVTNVNNYKWAQILFAGIPTLILLVITVYLYAKHLFRNDFRIALLSVLFVCIANRVQAMVGVDVTPNALGVSMAFLLFYVLLIREGTFANIPSLLVILITSIFLVLEHTVSYVFLVTQIIIFALYYVLGNNKTKTKALLCLLVFLIIIAFIEWAYISGYYFDDLILMIKYLIKYKINLNSHVISSSSIPASAGILAYSGMIIYFMLSSMTLLLIFFKILRGDIKNSIFIPTSGVVGLFLLGGLTFIVPAMSGIAGRFWYYAEILSSPFVSFLIINFLKINKRRRKLGILVAILLIISISYLMFRANWSNDDNPLSPAYSPRTGWTDSELQEGKFIIQKGGEIPISSDFDYSWNLRYLKTYLSSTNKLEDITRTTPQTFSEIERCDCIFVFRSQLLTSRLFYLGGRWSQTPYYAPSKMIKILEKFKKRYNIIYSAGSVISFLIYYYIFNLLLLINIY